MIVGVIFVFLHQDHPASMWSVIPYTVYRSDATSLWATLYCARALNWCSMVNGALWQWSTVPQDEGKFENYKRRFYTNKIVFFYVQVTSLYLLVCFVIAKVHIFKVLFQAKIKFTTCFAKIQITRYHIFCYFHFFHRCSQSIFLHHYGSGKLRR